MNNEQEFNTKISKSIGWAFNYFNSEEFKITGKNLEDAVMFRDILKSLLTNKLILVSDDRLKELENLANPKDTDKVEGEDG